MAIKVTKDLREQKAEAKNFSWDDLRQGEAVLDPDDGELFVRTDEGWVSFWAGAVSHYSDECIWHGLKVEVVEVIYK